MKYHEFDYGLASRSVMKSERNSATSLRAAPSERSGREDPLEAEYLAYILGPDGRFLWLREFDAANDDEARTFAKLLGEYVELWKGTSFVAKIGPTNLAQ